MESTIGIGKYRFNSKECSLKNKFSYIIEEEYVEGILVKNKMREGVISIGVNVNRGRRRRRGRRRNTLESSSRGGGGRKVKPFSTIDNEEITL